MRRILLSILSVLFLAMPALAQTTAITASHLAQDASGTLLASGKFCLQPVNQATGIPSGFEASGIQYGPGAACFTVTAGAISGVSMPDTTLTNPAVGYRVTLQNATGQTINTWAQPITPSGTTFNFDTWSPTQITVITNPTGIMAAAGAPTGRCGINPAIQYTGTDLYLCWQQIWSHFTLSGSLSAASIEAALGLVPVQASDIAAAIAAQPAYLPLTGGNISGTLNLSDSSPAASQAWVNAAIAAAPVSVTQSSVLAALGYTPLSSADLNSTCLLTGCTMSGAITSPDGTALTSQSWVNAAIAAAITSSPSGGGGTSGGTTAWDDGIGTVTRTGSMSDGSISIKTCYVGGTVCSGGVGNNPPASTPTKLAGQATPNAGTGTSNAVAVYTLSTIYPKVGTCYTSASPNTLVSSSQCYTEALWTTAGGGLGADTTSTNWARDFWVKANFAAGTTHIEFDTYNFSGTWDYMFGTQCEYSKYIIQIDNQSNGWVDTSVPCGVLYDGNWHHVQQTGHLDLAANKNCAANTAPCEYWDDIWIDSKLYVLGQKLPATTSTWTGSGGQIQLDMAPNSASSGTPATDVLYVDSDTVTFGSAETTGTTNPGGNGGTQTAGTGELGSFNFDSSNPTSGLVAVGSPAISTSNYHSAPNSMSFPTGNNYFTYALPTQHNVIYTRQYIYISSQGSTALSFLRFYGGTSGGQELFVWYLSTGGVITAFDQTTNSSIGSSFVLTPGTPHLVETYTKIDPSAGQVIVKVDGTVQYTSAATLNTGSTPISYVWFGAFGSTAPVGYGTTYEDNVDFSAVNWVGPI